MFCVCGLRLQFFETKKSSLRANSRFFTPKILDQKSTTGSMTLDALRNCLTTRSWNFLENCKLTRLHYWQTPTTTSRVFLKSVPAQKCHPIRHSHSGLCLSVYMVPPTMKRKLDHQTVELKHLFSCEQFFFD